MPQSQLRNFPAGADITQCNFLHNAPLHFVTTLFAKKKRKGYNKNMFSLVEWVGSESHCSRLCCSISASTNLYICNAVRLYLYTCCSLMFPRCRSRYVFVWLTFFAKTARKIQANFFKSYWKFSERLKDVLQTRKCSQSSGRVKEHNLE